MIESLPEWFLTLVWFVTVTGCKSLVVFVFTYVWTWLPIAFVQSQYSNAALGGGWGTKEGLFVMITQSYYPIRMMLAIVAVPFFLIVTS